MKIVINQCFGGFSLSPLAVRRFAELLGKECYFFKTPNLYTFVPIDISEINGAFWSAFTVADPNTLLHQDIPWHKMTESQRKDYNQKYDEIHIDNRPENRINPKLIQVVEELGEKANGSCAELKIVEVPDDVNWTITEYDGLETVEEVHKSWN